LNVLDIHQSSNDPSIIVSVKKSLQKRFKLTSYKDVEKAVMLANYLVCFGRTDEATKLLDCFILEIPYQEDREDLWNSVGQGIILRAYIASNDNDEVLHNKLIDIINDSDIMTDRCGRYELYLECLEDHADNIDRAVTETQKYKCEIWSQEALTFLYFYEMLPFYNDEVPSHLEQDIKSLVEKCYAELKISLST